MSVLYLAPSSIHGVGVFTDKAVAAGADLTEWLWDRDEPCGWALADSAFARRVGVIGHDGERPLAYVPRNPARMSIGWYLNHSDEPNLIGTEYPRFLTTRAIVAGGELLIDYRMLGPGNEVVDRMS